MGKMNDFLRKIDTDILLHCLTLIIISNIIVITIIASKIIKYLGINLPKEAKDP